MSRKHLLAAVIVVVLILQVLVPTIALFQDLPARFGFQMYSGYGRGTVTVMDAAGAPMDVDVVSHLPRLLRAELDWTEHLPEHLCAAIPGAATIVVEFGADSGGAVQCAS